MYKLITLTNTFYLPRISPPLYMPHLKRFNWRLLFLKIWSLFLIIWCFSCTILTKFCPTQKANLTHQAPKFPLVLLYTFHQFLILLEESYTRTRLKIFILWMVFVEYSQCWLFNTIKYSTLHIKDFSSKCDQVRKKLWIWLHLLEKSLMENLIFNHQFNFSLCLLCKKTDLEI